MSVLRMYISNEREQERRGYADKDETRRGALTEFANQIWSLVYEILSQESETKRQAGGR